MSNSLVAEDDAVSEAETLVLALAGVGHLHNAQHIAVLQASVRHNHPETAPCRPVRGQLRSDEVTWEQTGAVQVILA